VARITMLRSLHGPTIHVSSACVGQASNMFYLLQTCCAETMTITTHKISVEMKKTDFQTEPGIIH